MSVNEFRNDVANTIAIWRRQYGYAAQRDLGALAGLRRIDARDDSNGPCVDVAKAFTTGRTPYAPEGFAGLRRKIARMLDEAGRSAPHSMSTENLRARGDFDERLAAVAAALGSVRESRSGGETLGACLGGSKDHRAYPEARFKRLIRLHGAADLLREGRRIVHFLDAVPVTDFARTFLFWDHIEARRLTLAYYDAVDGKTTADVANA